MVRRLFSRGKTLCRSRKLIEKNAPIIDNLGLSLRFQRAWRQGSFALYSWVGDAGHGRVAFRPLTSVGSFR